MANYAKVFCAFCRTPRRVYKKKHANFVDVFLTFLLSLIFMVMIWEAWNPKFLLIWVAFCGVAEFIVQLRWRVGLSCPHCGFDPILYMKNRPRVVQKVKEHMQRRQQDPLGLLKPLPVTQIKRNNSTESLSASARQVRVVNYEDSHNNPDL